MGRLHKHVETHASSNTGWLRAAVMGANDGIVSTASLIVGVGAANGDRSSILIAGMAALIAGSMSMAAGEYVSVSSQSDTEKADLNRERQELAEQPERELEELAQVYVERGVERETALAVARQMTEHDALAAAFAAIEPNDLVDSKLAIQLEAHCVFRHARITGRRDQTLGRCQQTAAAVELERASLQTESSVDTGNPEVLTDLRGNPVIQFPGRILAAPGIVFPIDAKLLSLGPIFYERRPVVTNPTIVGRDGHDLSVPNISNHRLALPGDLV